MLRGGDWDDIKTIQKKKKKKKKNTDFPEKTLGFSSSRTPRSENKFHKWHNQRCFVCFAWAHRRMQQRTACFVLLVLVCALGCNAFTISVWNPPIIPVLTSQGVYQILFEAIIHPEESDALPVSVLNLSITGNDGSAMLIVDTFWGTGGNSGDIFQTVHLAGETLQQNLRFFNGDFRPNQ